MVSLELIENPDLILSLHDGARSLRDAEPKQRRCKFMRLGRMRTAACDSLNQPALAALIF